MEENLHLLYLKQISTDLAAIKASTLAAEKRIKIITEWVTLIGVMTLLGAVAAGCYVASAMLGIR